MSHCGRSVGTTALASSDPTIEVWGGIEYTCNRVGDRYFDQQELSGHTARISDYQILSQLGIRTLRFPVLWERHVLDSSWQFTDGRLSCLRQMGIRPIAGLVHHGSGPRDTSLLDPAFPHKLAAYARAVAERYPWIDAYTPVNEPNTTARFSALYGLWYPHHMSPRGYVRALFHQLKGSVLSMRAIRRVRPDAQFIQTDDVGNISGTPEMKSTWETLNLRQWLSFDLLCGRVNRIHPLFPYLRSNGLEESEIYWFADNPCPPDVIGANYYVTSDRYLDHRMDLYPSDRRSSEGAFVDVEAVRVDAGGIVGIESRVLYAWKRYGIPVAVTEIHLGCAADEQIRWLAESWEGLLSVQRQGAKCLALTSWALLGSFYWNGLVTCENGHYEAGAFDVREGAPMATPLARVIEQIARGQPPRHSALSHPGWWRHPHRVCFPCGERLVA